MVVDQRFVQYQYKCLYIIKQALALLRKHLVQQKRDNDFNEMEKRERKRGIFFY
jgi:hypothetical protein